MKNLFQRITSEANFLSLSGNLTISFFGFAGFALLARSFPIEKFGEWVLFISSIVFVEMFRLGITNTAIVRYLSGAGYDERLKIIGSNGLITLVATCGIAIILWTCHLFFSEPIKSAGYELFFAWYPLLAFINLPYNNALVILQADQRFDKILFIRSFESVTFFLILLLNFLFLKMTLVQLVIVQLIINVFTSTICIINGWDGFRYLSRATKKTTKLLLDFGKYTTFTLIGTNLLRSADTLIISLSPLGTAAVALYSIPMKLTEIQQIPLRSFVATAFPKMSKASGLGNTDEVKDLFYSYSGAMTYLFVIISLVTFVFAEFFVSLLGGSQYLVTDPVTGFNTVAIMRVFSIYGLLLPIDRMTGISLDSINKPGKNFIKVCFMVTTNIIGDLIAVYIFKSLLLVAIASILFTIIGVWVGFYFLDNELQLDKFRLFSSGLEFYKSMYQKFKNRGS